MRCLYFHPVSTLRSTIISLIRNCSNIDSLQQIHSQMIRSGLINDIFLVSRIMAFVTSPYQSYMSYAFCVFDEISHPNLFIWNCMIRGYTHCNASQDALLVYKLMLSRGFTPDDHTFTALTRACMQVNALQTGTAIHGQVLRFGFELDMYVMSGFISLYSNFGDIMNARKIFDEMPERDVVSWTSVVSGYAHSGLWDETFHLLDEMKVAGLNPNNITIIGLLSACRQPGDLDKGIWIHNYIAETNMPCDLVVGNSLVNMYANFKGMAVKDTVTWNVLIGGYVQNGLSAEALTMFHDMTNSGAVADEITLQGRFLHAYIEEHQITCDIFVSNALVNMYAKCGDLEKAENIFAMISGNVDQNCFEEALVLFQAMLHSNVEPNELGALDHGKQIHYYIEENKIRKDRSLENALLDMYAKCGYLEAAFDIFHAMPQKDIFSWNAMLGGLAAHGHGKEAIDLFTEMEKNGDAKPDLVTLIAVLSACSHSGMILEGLSYFNSMTSSYGIVPDMEHYGCMVDLLGRAGRIKEAIHFMKQMPVSPNSVIWGSLLSACRVHHNIELGEIVTQQIIKFAPSDEGAHILLSNLYAEAGRWDDVKRVRALMGSKGIGKSPGCSSIELNGVVHEFFASDMLLHWNNLHSLNLIKKCLSIGNYKHTFVCNSSPRYHYIPEP
ncbi:TPR-like protein [Dioscorea alata]|uniref:TPR-like protein n=1 Tax=Dioscorea alata TaxID=55571 RepID=A0ACB7UA99_DIOAL|nr:TPR-like protein [Dioscorea alata]